MSHPGHDLLSRIAAAIRARLPRGAPPAQLVRQAREVAEARRRGEGRSLQRALAAPGVRVVAECKRRSPSAGWLRPDFEPVQLARAYQEGGAAAISVVTEPEYFAGELIWLRLVRGAVALPVLQKDFILSRRQLVEAVVAGADAVLLIARLLPGRRLGELVAAAAELALETVVEVHDRRDLERVLAAGVGIVGINSRDLATFRVNLEEAGRLAELVPPEQLVLIESGIRGGDTLRPFLARGRRQFLVGEYLLRSDDPAAALRELVACGSW